ncbi:GNAT family N-acetyltransferase [Nocardioides sp. Leaf307]|uniref:GNAT family N-acetyltransferase n=1 Tax=Nocardioides sp. Leaf307 TaxID=1736331 RepID=UPI001F19BE0F|nr:GNAT family N-acetyltransferase [Nocardioides sp. Leaf307]
MSAAADRAADARGVRLDPVTGENIDALLEVAVRPDQEHFVGSVAKSLAEAYAHGPVAWPRAIVATRPSGEEVVGFVMAFLDVEWDDDPADVRSGLWRLNVDAAHQGRGHGAAAVRAVCAELRSRGCSAAYVTYHEGPGSPAPFYAGLGFVPTGELSEGETVARLDLHQDATGPDSRDA